MRRMSQFRSSLCDDEHLAFKMLRRFVVSARLEQVHREYRLFHGHVFQE